jgi:hypothetical protein
MDYLLERQAWAWLYAVNIHVAKHGEWSFSYLNHFWSLSVEEHFYLFWPLVVFLLARRPRTLLALSIGLSVGAMVARLAGSLMGVSWFTTGVLTPFRLDGLALPSQRLEPRFEPTRDGTDVAGEERSQNGGEPTPMRDNVLLRCLHLRRCPDAAADRDHRRRLEPGMESTRERVLRELAPLWPSIRWHHVEAGRRSISSQRNQGIRAASVDVVFLFDDDSLMYPDCAAEIMRVYDADSGRSVGGATRRTWPYPPMRRLRAT